MKQTPDMRDEKMTEKKEKLCRIGWYVLVFGFLYIWFTRIKPLVAYDGDDWLYLSFVRRAVPIWKDWNPARVLPEVLMPLCGAVAAYGVMPLTGDYIGSITIVSAAVTSGFIVVYVWCFEQLMRHWFNLKTARRILVSALFLLLHFMVFRGDTSNNNYLFHCWDLTCVYYYLIPALLNCSLVMYMMAHSDCREMMAAKETEKASVFLAVAYFAVFSNLPSSVILGIYAGVRILVDLIRSWKKVDWKAYLKDHMIHGVILFAWLLSAVFELTGARAQDDMGYRLPFLQGLKETTYRFLLVLKNSNEAFLLFTVVVVVLALVVFLRSRKQQQEKELLWLVGETVLCAVIMLAAVLILCTKVDITYVERSEYLFGLYFYGFLILLTALLYVLSRHPRLWAVLPLLLCILASYINTDGMTFMDSNLQCCEPNVCKAINEDIIEQITTASMAGQEVVTIYVPVTERPGNWPHASFVGDRIANTLYEHGLLNGPIRVEVQPSLEMNRKYNLYIPETVQ